jgi:hypothetical protein
MLGYQLLAFVQPSDSSRSACLQVLRRTGYTSMRCTGVSFVMRSTDGL